MVTDLRPLPGPERPQACIRNHVLRIERADETGGETHQVVGVLAIDLFVSHYNHVTPLKAFLGDTVFRFSSHAKDGSGPELVSGNMNQEEPRRTSLSTWLLLASVFVAALVVTLVVGTRGDSEGNDFPDLGDIASQDPNLPGDEEVAPRFALPTFAGDTFDLAEHVADDGRPVILNLWASWCGPCRAEMPAIDTSASQHPEVAYIGVAVMDNEDDAKAFAEEIGVTYALAHDDGSVEDAYPVLGLPATIYINGDGTIAKTHFGVVTVDSLDEEIAELFGS